jgi:NAD(P)-dependent dehydrogenase (short-subunit alcohol dehydrogenase family)
MRATGFEVSEIPNLNGFVAIVTGGNSNIGYETTLQLARHGARVYIASRSAERVNEAIRKMQSTQPSLDVHFLKFDLQDLESIKGTAADFLAREGRLDLLICNAGVSYNAFSSSEERKLNEARS